MAADTRAVAARALAEVMAGRSLNQALPQALARVSGRDRGLLQQLCYGTLRQAPRLQGILGQLLDKPLRDKDADVHSLLLCGLYQLEDTRIPDHAAVSATVAATRALKKPWAKGLSNAVLRRFLRERELLLAALDDSARAAHPQWLYDTLRAQWPAHSDQIIHANNNQPPMTLRVNAQQIQRDPYRAMLAEAGIESSAGLLSPQAIYLKAPVDVTELPGFAEGMVSVQDEGAQMAALVLAAQAGERVLDACAAPGGKSCHILEIQPGITELVTADVDALRLERVEENLQRLRLPATLLKMDATNPPVELVANFDRILVDAPCSASGVIRRHPDVKLLRREQDIPALGKQQRDILDGLWPLLKGGGSLLYATCSVLEGENDDVIGSFLQHHPDATVVPIEADWGEETRYGRQLLPSEHGPDGLFYCLVLKT